MRILELKLISLTLKLITLDSSESQGLPTSELPTAKQLKVKRISLIVLVKGLEGCLPDT